MLVIQKAQALGGVLIELGVLRQDQLNQALIEQRRSGQLLGKALLQMDLASEEQVAQAVGSGQAAATSDDCRKNHPGTED